MVGRAAAVLSPARRAAFVALAAVVGVYYGTHQHWFGLTLWPAIAFLAFLVHLYQPVVRLAGAAGLLSGTIAAGERIAAVLFASEDNSAGRRRPPDTIHGGRLEHR